MLTSKNNFLLVYGHLRTGGIETLIVRMANWLVKEGYNVNIILKEPGELLELLDNRINVEILDLKKYFIFFPLIGKLFLKNIKGKQIDYIFSFGPEGCYLASYINRVCFNSKNNPVLLNGIYHPNEFSISGTINILDRMYMELYEKYINNSAKLFMSEQVKESNEQEFKKKFVGARIWPLPIDPKNFKNVQRKPIPYKIVSIGRFAEFKTYNLFMFDVVEMLRKCGFDATWEVYGYGPLEKKMNKILQERKMSDCVYLNGKLKYSDYGKALSVAHVFVGVGTSLIEAGFCKVPCIPAIQNDTNGLTYGYLHELPYYACGEVLGDDYKKSKIFDMIKKIFEMDEAEYENNVKKTYEYVQAYSIDKLMMKFLDIIQNTPIDKRILGYPIKKYYLYSIKYIYFHARNLISMRTRLKKLWRIFQRNGNDIPWKSLIKYVRK